MNAADLTSYLQGLQTFVGEMELERVDPEGLVQPVMRIRGANLIPLLVINQHTLRDEVDRVAAEVMHWGALRAHARRVWEVREREMRTWRSRRELEIRAAAQKAGEKVTESVVEARYRTDPEYGVVNSRVEAAEAQFNLTDAAYQAFKVKADVLQADVRRAPDGSLQRASP